MLGIPPARAGRVIRAFAFSDGNRKDWLGSGFILRCNTQNDLDEVAQFDTKIGRRIEVQCEVIRRVSLAAINSADRKGPVHNFGVTDTLRNQPLIGPSSWSISDFRAVGQIDDFHDAMNAWCRKFLLGMADSTKAE